MKRACHAMVIFTFLIIFDSSVIFAQNSVIPGIIHTDSTIINIGVRWQITGDDDHDSSCALRFRKLGDVGWLPGLDLVRTHPFLYGEGNDRPDNRFAGSIFFLEPETTYEIELALSDPDGGGTTQVVNGTTGKEMISSTTPRELYVVSGSGGGTGTMIDPFRGLQEAANNALPGDIFYVAAGTYSSFVLLESGTTDNPIVFKGPADPITDIDELNWAIVDGADTTRGVFTIGAYDITTSHIIVENLVIQNGYWGVDAQNTQYILFKRNIVRNVGFGFYNRRANGWELSQMLTDNIFTGRTAWPGSGIPSERGIDLRGTGNIVCYNRVQNFGDGVSIQPNSSNAYANDIYGNDIAYIVDDPIEIDYNVANARVWRNRVANGRMGISLAPIYGGPVYVFRNEFFNLEESYSAYKMNREPAGLVIIHNTSSKMGNGTSSPSGWQNTFLRNNVMLGTRYVMEEYGLISGSIDDWDYDALGTTYVLFAKWDNIRYADLNELRTSSGIEAHAVAANLGDLINAPLLALYTDGITPGSYDLRLNIGVPAIDAGEVLPNINDPFVFDRKPDCGAFEYGQPLPPYGPRTTVTVPISSFFIIIGILIINTILLLNKVRIT